VAARASLFGRVHLSSYLWLPELETFDWSKRQFFVGRDIGNPWRLLSIWRVFWTLSVRHPWQRPRLLYLRKGKIWRFVDYDSDRLPIPRDIARCTIARITPTTLSPSMLLFSDSPGNSPLYLRGSIRAFKNFQFLPRSSLCDVSGQMSSITAAHSR
jgi:hypothetical protein